MQKIAIALSILLSISFSAYSQVNIYGIDVSNPNSSSVGWEWDSSIGTYVKFFPYNSIPFDAVCKFQGRDFRFIVYSGMYENMPTRFENAYSYLIKKFGTKITLYGTSDWMQMKIIPSDFFLLETLIPNPETKRIVKDSLSSFEVWHPILFENKELRLECKR